jgi:ABC-2 type transport system ATP-binding protein
MDFALSVRDLVKIYPGKKPFLAVDKISFDLKAGEILGLLGPNGSGKTTTIQMLLGTLSTTSGSIRYFGKDFERNRTEILNSISFASTYTSLPFILTVEENLEVLGRMYGFSAKESRKRYDPLLERFGIFSLKKKRVSGLSAGQVTRLMLAKAFFTEPKIVLLDEPTASLDPDISREICEFILEERDRSGLSILFTSHKMEEVAEVCDRVIFLKEGKIIADDLPEKLAKSVSRFRLRLVIADGLKRTVALAEQMQCPYTLDHRAIDISIDEKQIPAFLNALGKGEIVYSTIHIEEPSLEDYFLQVSKRKK